MFELTVVLFIFVFFIIYLGVQQSYNKRRIMGYTLRVHVNGIRGKSTVTRLIAGVLREAGYRTVAKTTGSEAVTIDLDGNDIPIPRGEPSQR